MSDSQASRLLQELNAEYRATLACLQRIPETLFEFKPHPKSMSMGYLSLLVAEIPLWIQKMVVDGEIDLAGFQHFSPRSTDELLRHFEENMQAARAALESASEEELQKEFLLKANGKLLYSAKKAVDLPITLNHWVHHRGQLTVYLRMLDVPLPGLYGPTADDQSM